MRRALIAFALVLAFPATAAAKTETAQEGSVVATITYKKSPKSINATGIHLTISDGDTQIVDQKIRDKEYLAPLQEDFYDGKAVGVRDFDGDGTPEVVFDFFTGGAHCCVLTYLYDGATLVKQDWGNVGYGLKDYDGDGVPEFDSEDDAFSGLFAAYAGSFRPLRVLQFRDGTFDDAVTRDPSVAPALTKDRNRFARLAKKYAKKVKDPIYQQVVESAVGALTATDCLLGDCAPGYTLADEYTADGVARRIFPRRLHRQMRRLGYDPPA